MEALRPLGWTDDSVMDAESKSMRPEGGQKGRRCRRAGAVVSRQHCPPGAAFPGLPGWSSGQDHMRPPGGGSSAPGLGSKICTLSWAAGKKSSSAPSPRFPGGSAGKASAHDAGELGSIPGSGRSLRGKWQPAPVPLPGESHGQRSLVSCSPWGHKGSDTTE